jgi:hypothetical protein
LSRLSFSCALQPLRLADLPRQRYTEITRHFPQNLLDLHQQGTTILPEDTVVMEKSATLLENQSDTTLEARCNNASGCSDGSDEGQ